MSLGITAAGWTAIAGVGATIYGANKASGAAKDAATATVQGNQASIEEARRQYDLTRADQLKLYDQTRDDQLKLLDRNREDQLLQLERTRLDAAPGREVGLRALYQLDNASGPGGEFGPAGGYQRKAFAADPGYQFRVIEGEKGIRRATSARGGMYSGATLKALARFNSDLGSQEYGAYDTRERNNENQFNASRDFRRNNLASLAGLGQTATRDVAQAGATATGAVGQAGQNAYGAIGSAGQGAYGTIARAGDYASGQVGGALQNQGEARASGYVGSANAIGSGIRQIYNNFQQKQFMSRPNYPDFNTWSPGYGDTSRYDAGAASAAANGGWGIE